jgi:hypothetical protein
MFLHNQQFVFGDGDGGGSAVADAPAPSPAPSPAPAAPAPKAAAPAAPAPAPADPDPGYWKPDWRERLAGGDEKVLKQLQRYASVDDVWKKARALEGKVSAGELRPALPKNASPEMVAEFRKAHGIPEKADAYDIKDLKLDDVDKPLVEQVLKAAHAVNASPDVVKAVVGVWPKLKADAAARQHEMDTQAQQKGEDERRGEWGEEFRRNMSLITQLMDRTGDKALKDNLLSGRLADGTPIGSSPAALKMLLGVALQANPTGTVLSGSGGDPLKGMDDRIAEIEKLMRTDRPAYNKDEKMQDEYRRLLTARDSMKR